MNGDDSFSGTNPESSSADAPPSPLISQSDQVTLENLKVLQVSPTTSANQITEEDLIDFLSHTLDSHRSQTVQVQLQEDLTLRQQAVALQSTWDLLDLLPADQPAVSPAEQARKILKNVQKQESRVATFNQFLAFSLSFLLFTGGWFLGQRWARPHQAAILAQSSKLPLLDYLLIVNDEAFLKLLMNDPKAPLFQNIRPFEDADYHAALVGFHQKPQSENEWQRLRSQFQTLSEQSSAQQKKILEMAGWVQDLPQDKQNELMSRLAGLLSWYESLPEPDRLLFMQARLPNRWNRAVAGIEQIRRQNEAVKNKVFTVTEFNRPDYVMDLATITATWLKMNQPERIQFERKSRNQRIDPQKKNDRFRALAQAIETAQPGTFPVLEAMKNSPRGKAVAKAELSKKERDRRVREYLELLRTVPISTNPQEIGEFLEKLPPWLVEVVDPMPPDEARRLLGILKVLVDHQLNEKTL